MSLFKYLPKKYLDTFFRHGSLKIGTLYEYRKVEHYGEVIGDKDEGLHRTTLSHPGGILVDLATNTPEANFIRKTLPPHLQDAKNKIYIENGAGIISESNSQNLYIYSMSSECSNELMKAFGCDACMEIVNPQAFFSAISNRIQLRGKFDSYGAVQYISKDTHYTKPHHVHPAIMKDVEFSYQKEWRAIWIPRKEAKEPLFIDVPKAIQHCRIIVP